MCLKQGKLVHQQIIVYGIHHDPFKATKFIQMYADRDDLPSSQNLVDKLPQLNMFAWTAILPFCVRHGIYNECVRSYDEMKCIGTLPDKFIYPEACAQILWLGTGILVHKDVIVYGCEYNFKGQQFVHFYVCEMLEYECAKRVFDETVSRDLLTWNSIISVSAYVSNGLLYSALKMLNYMKLNGFDSDMVTWNTIWMLILGRGFVMRHGKILNILRSLI